MSIIISNNQSQLKSFFSDRKGGERSETLDVLTRYIEQCEDGLAEFVFLWGAGNKTKATKSDKDCLLYLFHFLKKVEDLYQVNVNLNVVFTDTHAYLNGYDHLNYDVYIREISYHIKKHGFQFLTSSALCHTGFNEAGYPDHQSFIDHVIAHADEFFGTLELKENEIKSVSNFYHYALRHCVRIGHHQSGICFENEESAAKAYLYVASFEKRIISKVYNKAAFITYLAKDESAVFPDLPVIRIYSIKSGLRTRPWFTCE